MKMWGCGGICWTAAATLVMVPSIRLKVVCHPFGPAAPAYDDEAISVGLGYLSPIHPPPPPPCIAATGVGLQYWTVTVDVSYLQAYLQPGLPTRFSLGNVLSNTYNVPIWAKATLAIYYQTEAPSRTLLPESAISAGVEAVAAARTSFKSQHSHFSPNMTEISRTNMSFSTHNVTGVLVTPGGVLSDLPADVPTEVIPLTIANNDYESLVSVSGNGDRCDR